MLPIELLRTRINRNKISPLFCSLDVDNSNDFELAQKIINQFQSCNRSFISKGVLLDKINLLETIYDHKLVRGLFTLLERRSVFENTSSQIKSNIIRKQLFEESAIRGLALSDMQRKEIIDFIAKKNNLSSYDVENTMWSDQDENLVMINFDSISPSDLLLLYNLSLAQTLLFRCIGMKFSIDGGLYWKNVLRNVKRFGLMYNLEYSETAGSDSIFCNLEGPMSLFKMTERYGTSIAKLLPLIVMSPKWSFQGSILRKNDEGKKIFQFDMSDKTSQAIFQYPSKKRDLTSIFQIYSNTDLNFDSSLEERFEKIFLQYFNKIDDWKISREPNPIIADGKAMIPDFLFERYGRKVYFEIVGFWTQDYLKRKASKLTTIFRDKKNKESRLDLIVGINSELNCSQFDSIQNENFFTFKKEVPIKPILEHLKKIDREIVQEKIKTTDIILENEPDIIPIQIIAKTHNVPEETAMEILSTNYPELISVGKTHMISNSKINELKDALYGITNFVSACKIFDKNKIPESCHGELLSQLGYDVKWTDLDPNNAIISEKNI